ncbi:MAG: VOC family protein [Phycisphaeraceae bacterium]|nr:VOC family protein [Phycisphaeraceae bacterium]
MLPFRLLETAIHVESVRAARDWYARVFRIQPLNPDHDDRLCAMNLPGAQVLLIFKRGGSTQTFTFPGGKIPPHDSQGTTHLAFAIAESDLAPWRAHLASLNIAIESEMRWDRGGTSLYFRDLDGHLLELVTPGVWPTY